MPDPSLLPEEVFEDRYMVKFDALIVGRGLKVGYARDRAATDIGVMWTAPDSNTLTGVRVWFQLKGKHTETLSAEGATQKRSVPVKVDVAQLRFWYAAPEATYLAVYVESLDTFFARDVRDIVEERWGPGLLAPGKLDKQETVIVDVPLTAVFDEAAVVRIAQVHRSMRIDGPTFRGRSLGHRFDPLRSELAPLAPDDYETLVRDILSEHLFRVDTEYDPSNLIQGVGAGGHQARVLTGTLWTTYEYIFGASVEQGFGPYIEPRSEGTSFSILGKVAVVIHSNVGDAIEPAANHEEFLADLAARGYTQFLVFANCDDFAHSMLFPWRRQILDGACRAPQGLHSLAYNVLVATLVYLNNIERLAWKQLAYNLGADAIATAEYMNSLAPPEFEW